MPDGTTPERPTRCGCPEEELAAPPRNSIDSYTITQIDGLPEKAKIFPGTGMIHVDRAFWLGLNTTQRQAVLAHELAHDENPDTCESCTDARAGARLRHAGISAEAAVRALSSVVGSRRAGEPLLYGWNVADAAIRGKVGQRDPVELTSGPGNVAAPTNRPYGLDDGQSQEGEDEAAGQSFGAPTGTTQPRPVQAPRAHPVAPKPDASSFGFGAAELAIAAGVVLVIVYFSRKG